MKSVYHPGHQRPGQWISEVPPKSQLGLPSVADLHSGAPAAGDPPSLPPYIGSQIGHGAKTHVFIDYLGV